ncbi:hypothetical protein CCACVL1_22838, partial [Corchorus capsularis]
MHTTKWPSLGELHVEVCDEVEIIFAANISEYGEELKDRRNIGQGEERQLHSQPLFWTTKDNTFPRLKELELRLNRNLREI